MNEDHDDLRHLLGPWVLGGLDAGDRARFAAHLAVCAECRAEVEASAPVPGLLRRVPDGAWSEEPAAPGTDDDASVLLRAVARARRRRRQVTVAVGAVAATVLIAVGALLGSRLGEPPTTPGPHTVVALQEASDSRVSGRARLEPRPWGTALVLDVRGLPASGRYLLVVQGTDGTRETGGSWGATGLETVRVVGATSLPIDSLTSVDVVAAGGPTLAEAQVSGAVAR